MDFKSALIIATMQSRECVPCVLRTPAQGTRGDGRGAGTLGAASLSIFSGRFILRRPASPPSSRGGRREAVE